MSTNAPPSINPADLDSLTGTFREIFNKLIQSVDNCLPAQVISYDKDTRRVSVQPLISVVKTNGESVVRAPIASIPVLTLGAGNFVVDFNYNAGDQGYIIANDRDISNFLATQDQSVPNTFRKKNFADSFFVPSVFKTITRDPEDDENLVIQSLDGLVKISWGADTLKIKAPTIQLECDSLQIECETAEIDATTDLTITTPTLNIDSSAGVNITTPTLAVTGNITASGSITPFVP